MTIKFHFSYCPDSSSTSNRSCQDGPGKCNFTLALALLLDGPRCIGYYCELPFGYLPGPKHILCALRNFISWIQGRAREKSCGSNRHVTEMLIRNGHYNVAEVISLIYLLVSKHVNFYKTNWIYLYFSYVHIYLPL